MSSHWLFPPRSHSWALGVGVERELVNATPTPYICEYNGGNRKFPEFPILSFVVIRKQKKLVEKKNVIGSSLVLYWDKIFWSSLTAY